jgi:RHS repeat-associated protein
VTSPGGQTTVSWINARDQQIQQTQPASGTSSASYDAAGNLASQTTGGGTATYAYDHANEPTAITYSNPASGFAATSNVAYSYDADGNRTQMTDGTGTTSYTYDPLERLSSVTNGARQSVGYAYNADNRVSQLTYPGSEQTVANTYDHAGRETSVSDWLGNTTTFAYNADGAITSEAYPDNITDSSTYDQADNLLSTSVAPNSTPSESIATYTYTYSSDGQVATETDTGMPGPSSRSYAYNPAGQLTAAGASQYAYDQAGDPTTLESNSGYTYNTAGQLTSSPASADLGSTSYTYDQLGDRTSATVSGGQPTTYGYDQVGQLAGVSQTGSSQAYAYDSNGLLASSTVGSTTDNLVWDQSTSVPLLLFDGKDSNVYGPDGLPIEQISTAGNVSYLHHDQLGSTRLITDPSGNTTATITYSPYGQPEASTGTATTNLGYAGQYTDPTTGLVYLRARWYDPATGEFLTVDPLVANTQEPYSYGDDDPINGTDPTGLACGLGSLGDCLSDAWRVTANFGAGIANSGAMTVNGIVALGTLGQYDPNLRVGPAYACAGGYTEGVIAGFGLQTAALGGALTALDPLGLLGGAAEDNAGSLWEDWQGTNMSDEDSFSYHYAKHGAGQTAEQYSQDASSWAQNPAGSGTEVRLANGETGIRYRTPGGGPGGILDQSGKIVTFWYH